MEIVRMGFKADNISTRGPSVPTEAKGSAHPPDAGRDRPLERDRALDKERFEAAYRGESVPTEAKGSARPPDSGRDRALDKERFDHLYRGESVPAEARGSARPPGSEKDRALNKERFEGAWRGESVPTGAREAAPTGPREAAPPPGSEKNQAGDKERFLDAYRAEVGGPKKEGLKEPGDKGGDPASLSSLFQNRFPETATAPRPLAGPDLEASPAPAAPTLDIEKMVSRILVSDPAHSPNNQVRLSLNDSFLPGVEVLIRRDNDGLLTVSFASSDAGSLQTLLAARSTLKEALDQTENREVRLTIAGGDNASGDSDAHDRRSKGYVGFEPPGDE
jgi:type III secretion system needle length determinant